MQELWRTRFLLAWAVPLVATAAAWHSPLAAWIAMLLVHLTVALCEQVPALRHSPPAAPAGHFDALVLRGYVLMQAGMLAVGVSVALRPETGWVELLLLGIAMGSVSGGQGITFAHELGHSKSRLDRLLGWLLMGSVNYAHFMVEHYRGHHPRAATEDDPASARAGESLWRFLPRTLIGSLRSAWVLEHRQLVRLGRGWHRSPLVWATLAQAAWLLLLWRGLGAGAALFWLLQSAQAVFMLETINYIEHYGLKRRIVGGQREGFGVMHAWNADHFVTNAVLVNLQRHSDHHMHAWKPYATLQPLPGPQLPTGYAGCLYLACVPPLWFRLMRPRLAALPAG